MKSILALILSVIFCSPLVSRADIVHLQTGGKIRGKVGEVKKGAPTVTVSLDRGGRMTLLMSQVKRIQRETPPQVAYRKLAPATENTIKAQWSLAQWCKKWGLKNERAFHLQMILRQKPNHTRARHGLGFTQVQGKWIIHDRFQKDHGYAYYRGKWRLSQEIDLLETEAKRELAEQEWKSKLVRMRRVTTKKNAILKPAQIVSIKDPMAVRPLLEMIRKERTRYFKGLFIDALVNIGNGEAILAVLQVMVSDLDPEVYYYCLDRIRETNYPDTALFLTRTLKRPEMYQLNRAAHAIQTLEYETTIPALIDQLVRTYYVAKPGSDQITTTFGGFQDPTARGPRQQPLMSMQPNEQAQVYTYRVNSQRVLTALASLSGVNLGYDVAAWKRWYRIEQRRLGEKQLRRGAVASTRREQN